MLPDKLGGVHNFVANLLAHRLPDDLNYEAVLAHNFSDPDDPSDGDLRADVKRLAYRLPPENFHSVLRRVAGQISQGRGVLVANDWLSLSTASAHRTGKAVVYINHGDFPHYYDLAVTHDPTIDLFITYTVHMYDRLCALLPHRAESILNIPYGVEIPLTRPRRRSRPMRLLYVGRLDRSKGVMDLPGIDRRLRAAEIPVEWTIQGPGPAEQELKAAWKDAPHVKWNGRTTMERVKELYLDHDVLVMPSRAEGLPVALLEGMAHGCVPVVSDLPSGIPELVENGVSGFRVPVGDIAGFADAIASLASSGDMLRSMSDEAAARVKSKFDIAVRAPEYQRAIAAMADITPRWSRPHVFLGSRLDQPWIPNLFVTGARSLRRSVKEWSKPSGAPDDDKGEHGGLG
jgi:glycosyltransferase involved in cell wall biosynthesis